MLTTEQAAAQLGIAVRTVRQHIANGALKAIKEGRDWKIEEAELARFASTRRGKGRPKAEG